MRWDFVPFAIELRTKLSSIPDRLVVLQRNVLRVLVCIVMGKRMLLSCYMWRSMKVVGAMWRSRVRPAAVPRASPGGFEWLLHEREEFEPRSNRGRTGGWRAARRSTGSSEFAFLGGPRGGCLRGGGRGLRRRQPTRWRQRAAACITCKA